MKKYFNFIFVLLLSIILPLQSFAWGVPSWSSEWYNASISCYYQDLKWRIIYLKNLSYINTDKLWKYKYISCDYKASNNKWKPIYVEFWVNGETVQSKYYPKWRTWEEATVLIDLKKYMSNNSSVINLNLVVSAPKFGKKWKTWYILKVWADMQFKITSLQNLFNKTWYWY